MRRLATILTAMVLVALTGSAVWAQSSSPVTVPDSATLDEDTLAVVYPLLNDTDPGGGSLELTGVSSTPAGETRIDGAAVVFTPAPDWNGEVEVTYAVKSSGGEASGQISFTVTPVNDAPVAVGEAVNANSGTSVLLDVLANDQDVDGDSLRIIEVTASENATAELDGDVINYTAGAAFSGVDELTYVIADPAGATAAATVTIAVTFPPPTTTLPPTTAPPVTTAAPTTTVAPTTTAAPTTTVPATTAPPPTTAAPPTTVPIVIAVPPTTVAAPDYVTAPAWGVPQDGLVPPAGAGDVSLVASIMATLRSLYLPLLTLLVVGGVFWFLTQSGRSSGRRYAVILVGLGDTLPVRRRPGPTGEIVHRYEGSARQIESIGNPRTVDGVVWVPVSSPGGQGWVEESYLTEDVARVSFERDVQDKAIVREMKAKLKDGAILSTSPRGMIDPETFRREPGRHQLGSHATTKVAKLVGDWRAIFHIDKTASLAALRPPQLRNLHWISFEAPGVAPWQLFFEYCDGEVYPVAAVPERAPAEVDSGS